MTTDSRTRTAHGRSWALWLLVFAGVVLHSVLCPPGARAGVPGAAARTCGPASGETAPPGDAPSAPVLSDVAWSDAVPSAPVLSDVAWSDAVPSGAAWSDAPLSDAAWSGAVPSGAAWSNVAGFGGASVTRAGDAGGPCAPAPRPHQHAPCHAAVHRTSVQQRPTATGYGGAVPPAPPRAADAGVTGGPGRTRPGDLASRFAARRSGAGLRVALCSART